MYPFIVDMDINVSYPALVHWMGRYMEEQTIWSDKPVIRDLFLHPVWMLIIFFTTGLALIVIAYLVLVRRTTSYKLTTDRLILEKGILTKNVDDIELYRVRDTKVQQGMIDRLLGIGSVAVNTTDISGNWRVAKIHLPRETREKIRRTSEDAKQRRNVRIHTE